MPIPAFWSWFLIIVGIGKAAIAGAGVALAALGALDIAFAITARDFLHGLKPYYLDIAAAGGGIIGALVRAFIIR